MQIDGFSLYNLSSAVFTLGNDLELGLKLLLLLSYEGGMTMVEIAKRNNISERSIYRYKAYYGKLREAADNDSGN